MRRLQRQVIDLGQLFARCSGQKQDAAVRQRFVLAETTILDAAKAYEQLAQTMTIYQFAQPALPVGAATGADMIDLYKTTFVRKNGAGRWAYDQIKAAAPLGICPLCAQRPVGTIDHYLPKASHWILALTPDNLVPACRDCNSAKGEVAAQNEATQPFHPYFDLFDDCQWLHARIVRTNGISIEFYVADIPNWTPQRQDRTRHHFRLFDLGALYATQAAVELVNMKHRLIELHQAAGTNIVRTHLAEEARSRRHVHINSWQTALYEALSSDDPFCAADFNLI
jgi:hypothetical protein